MDSLPSEPPGKPQSNYTLIKKKKESMWEVRCTENQEDSPRLALLPTVFWSGFPIEGVGGIAEVSASPTSLWPGEQHPPLILHLAFNCPMIRATVKFLWFFFRMKSCSQEERIRTIVSDGVAATSFHLSEVQAR